MSRSVSSSLFFVVLLAAANFVWWTSDAMPATVASHFNGGGRANGFSSRTSYRTLMLGIMVVVPTLAAFLPGLMIRTPGARINLPNRDYWLAPERREVSIGFLCQHMTIFAILLVLFLAYVHWLVVLANGHTPPNLPGEEFMRALIGFLVVIGVWMLALFWRFRRVRD